MTGSATAEALRDRGEGSVNVFRAPLFERILQEEESDQRQLVLDLGGPCQSLIDRLSAPRPTRIEIADLVAGGDLDELRHLGPSEDAGLPDLNRFLPQSSGEPLDLILCWDLPNYLNLGTFAELCRLLGNRAAPGCRLHMLIAYSKREMPAQPARYSLKDDGQLIQKLDDAETVAAPRYSPEALGEAVGGFDYERGILLANGNQEFLYSWPDEARSKFDS